MTDSLLFLFAILPVLWLLISLCVLHQPGHIACSAGLLISLFLALVIWKMKIAEAATAVLEGVLFALWPILLVVTAAMILYKYSVASGGMEKIKSLLTGASSDKRILVLLLAWGFGGFLEGIAGFGTPVLIPGSILVSLGFSPMFSVVVCLIANSAPTPYATIGIPALTLSNVTGLDAGVLGFDVACQLLIPCILLPFFLVFITGRSWKAAKGVFWITLISGLSFAVPLLLLSKFAGPELPTLLGSVCSIAAVMISNKFLYKDTAHNRSFQIGLPREDANAGKITRDGAEGLTPAAGSAGSAEFAKSIIKSDAAPKSVSAAQAMLPFAIVLILVIAVNLIPAIQGPVSALKLTVGIYSGEGVHPLTFSWLSTPGIILLLSTFLSCLIQKQKISLVFGIIRESVLSSKNMYLTVITIISMAKVMNYSGMTDAIALVLIAVFGLYYPLVSPVVGMSGTFITGSDTTCCILFGSLQAEAAGAIGANPAWIAASNLSGAAIGKMISPQSVAVGMAVGGIRGKEGEIIKKTLPYCLICTAIICAITFAFA